ncbi:MAG TPA: nuclear transport factor 2 family protein [Coleofasciculaceae cyanobacterium]
MAEATPATLEIAQQAFRHFSHGLATAEWEPFLAMLTDDFTFWFPVGAYKGLNVGKERAASFFDFVSQVMDKGWTVTLQRVTSNETTVVFEFLSEGYLRGNPYQNQTAVSFDVSGDKICSYREYMAIVVPPKAD